MSRSNFDILSIASLTRILNISEMKKSLNIFEVFVFVWIIILFQTKPPNVFENVCKSLKNAQQEYTTQSPK